MKNNLPLLSKTTLAQFPMVTRRRFIAQSAATALALPACRRSPQIPPQSVVPVPKKRGLGMSTKNPAWIERLKSIRCQWFYSWGFKIPEGTPEGIQFIPMIYRYGGDAAAITETATAARNAGITELLGFNEPEVKKQGNMTMEEALEAWPLLMETGLRLGSPGCVHPDKEWMIEFMAAAKQRALRVDFVCVHSYGGPSPEALIRRLEKVHQMFDRPLWITEFAVGDWEAKSVEENRHKPETVLRFMEKVLPMLEKLDFLERYAWFPAKPSSAPLGTSALFHEDGSLTPLGECYRDA